MTAAYLLGLFMTFCRTLVIAEALPYPTYKGGDLRNWQNVTALANLGEVGVFGLCSNDQRAAQMPPGIALWRCASDPALAYPPPKDRKLSSRAWLLDSMGHPSDLYYSQITAVEIAEMTREFQPDIVVIEGPWLYRYIAEIKRQNCPVILDAHNVETSLYQQRAQTANESGLELRLIRDIMPARTAMIERQALHAADQIWACSEIDARLLSELHRPAAPVWVVPNGLNVEAYESPNGHRLPELGDRSKQSIIFPGTFAYWPNAAAAGFLIREFFPLLTGDCADYRLLLVGNRPTREMLLAAGKDPRILVTDTVPDVRPYLASASVLLVPLFEGGGTRFKILEGFASRIPVVSTAKGAEGLEVTDGDHLLIAEDAPAMVATVRRILSDECLRHKLTASAWDLLNRRYSWDVARGRIREAVEGLRAGIEQRKRKLIL
jgi:glycosyltransferase involved in cell wall biosynthesis